MANKTVLQLAVEAASAKKVGRTMEKAVGRHFWKSGYDEADRRLRQHMKLVDRMSDKAAEETSHAFMAVFANSASKFGKDLQKVVQEGSEEFEEAMSKALRKIRDIRASNDEEHAAKVEEIIENELKGMDRVIAKKKLLDRAKGGRGGKVSNKVGNAGGTLESAGTLLGGKAGGMVKGLGGGLSKIAGPVGVIVSVLGPILDIVKGLHAVSKHMQDVNKKALQYVSATDIMGTGTTAATDSITDLRSEFTDSVMANQKFRMSVEEGLESVNAFAQGGVSMGRAMRESGKTQREVTRDMAESAVTYATSLGISISEVGRAQGDMMLNLHYSLEQTKDAFSAIGHEAIKAGISSSVFFGKVQSLNSQIDSLNSSLKMQAKFMSDTADSIFGFESASKTAAQVLGKPTQQQALMDIYGASEDQAIAIVKQYQTYLAKKIQLSVDPEEKRKLETIMAKSQTATAHGGLALAQFMEVYADESTRVGLKMASLATVFGKFKMNLMNMTPDEFRKAVATSPEYMIEQIRAMGTLGTTTEEVEHGLQSLIEHVEKSGAASVEASLGASIQQSMDASGAMEADENLAAEYRRNTTDVAVILTNIKELLYNKIYDVLLLLYKHFAKSDQEVASAALRTKAKGLHMEVDSLEKQIAQAPSSTPAEKTARSALVTKRHAKKAEYDKVQKESAFLDNLDETGFRAHREKYGPDNKTYLSSVAGGQHAIPGFSTADAANMASHQKVTTPLGDVYTKLGKNYQQLMIELQNDSPGFSSGPQSLAAYKSEHGELGDSDGVNLLKYIQNYEDYYVGKGIIPAKAFEGVALAEGGIVNRPTIALIGEEGPEAVVPLGKGGGMGVTINIYGGDLQAVRREVGNALKVYDKSQRV